MTCLDDSTLQRILEGTLAPDQLARVEAHVDVCATCRELAADLVLARSAEAPGAGAPLLELGSATTPLSPNVGRRYVLGDIIGRGSMGSVYRTLDRLTGQTVALKRVPLGSPTAIQLQALAHEFRTLATLRHPHIVSVLDYGFDADRRPYFTMELLEGARPLLPLAASAPYAVQMDLLLQLLRALAYLHRRGILHRDLKPSNIMLIGPDDGTVLKVVDFGLSTCDDDAARLRAAGTLPYIAPEIFRGGMASEASDLYAAGIVAYEMLTGRHPFLASETPADLIAQVLHREPDLTAVPPSLRPVLSRALCKSPSGRPADATTLLREVALATGIDQEANSAPARDSYLAAARFTGRDRELAQLRGALDAACRGRGSAWLLGGESGVGKSRLLEELRTLALVEGVLAVRGQALPGSGTAYHVWRGALELLSLHVELSALEASVLSVVLPNLGALLECKVAPPPDLDVQGTRFRLLRVLCEVVRRSREPVLVLLEDLHWADAESLALLAQVSADLGGLPLLIVASYRDEEAPNLPSRFPAMNTLLLRRFDRSGIERLCASMLGPAGRDAELIDLIARETEGNTYFIVEVLRALAEAWGGLEDVGRGALPEQILAGGVQQVFARRLSRVPAEAQALLRLAAVAGRQLDLEALSKCVSGLPQLVQACADAGVLEMHEQRWRFGHDKLREKVFRELDAATLRELHGRIADTLELAYPNSAAHASRIAYHHREAHRPAAAAHSYALAGEAALARGAPAEAEIMLEQARLFQHGLDVPLLAQVRLWRGLAQARYALGRLADTNTALRQVCALAGTALPVDTVGFFVALGRSTAVQLAYRTRLARHLPMGPRSELERAIGEELLLALMVQEVYVWLARPELMFLCTMWGMNLEEVVCTQHRSNFRAAMAFLLSHTPLRRLSLRYFERRAPPLPRSQAELDYLRVQSMVWISAGRWVEAAESAAQAISHARAHRDDLSLMNCLIPRQLALAELDEYEELLGTSRELGRISARTQHDRFGVCALLGEALAWFRLGRLGEADAALALARQTLSNDLGPLPEAMVAGLSAVCALQQGHDERADTLALAALGAIHRARWAMGELRYAMTCVLDVFLTEGHGEHHRTRIQPLLAEQHRLARRFPFAEPNAWMLQGRYEHLQGRPARAAVSFRRSLHAAERLGSRFQRAQAHYWLARVAQSPGGRRHVPRGATAHARAAVALFERLGCAWEAARARRG